MNLWAVLIPPEQNYLALGVYSTGRSGSVLDFSPELAGYERLGSWCRYQSHISCIKSFMDCFVKVVCPVQFFLSTSHPCDITVLNCQFRFCMISAGYCILLLSFNQMGISFVCPLQGLRPRAVTCQTMPSQQAPLRWMPKDFFVLWSCRGLCSWRALLV